MSLIKSISGIRGTIGGKYRENLTPLDIVECTAGFATWILKTGRKPKVVVGRDGRISGKTVSQIAVNTLISMGIDVIDLGLSTTPTVEMYVPKMDAGAGIIFTASHNPKQWNALKFINENGEFISAQDGKDILKYIDDGALLFSDIDNQGTLTRDKTAIAYHIDKVLNYPLVNVEAIKKANISVVVDCINSTGAMSIPPLLDKLGVKYVLINEDMTGDFAHNPEPLPKHLAQLSQEVVNQKAHMGISVDPDVDRLAFVCEDGSMFGEEYTLVAVADYILSQRKGNTVSNLSSTRALSDVTIKHGGDYFASAVGEVNVVNAMKKNKAVIGGEGNGGIIVPDLHYGRDALIGIALYLSYVAIEAKPLTQIRNALPSYSIIKDKVDASSLNINESFEKLKKQFASERLNEIDGLKIDFANGWVHMRKSNTEPIIRIYAEGPNEQIAKELIDKVKSCL